MALSFNHSPHRTTEAPMEAAETRLLHLFKSFNIGGVEKSTILYSNEISKGLPFVGMFARKGVYDHTNIIAPEIVQCFPPFDVKLTALTLPLYVAAVLRIVRRHRITVLNYHHRVFVPVAWAVRMVYPSVKIVYTAHNYFNDAINRFIVADKIVAVSDAVRTDLAPIHGSRVAALSHGVRRHPSHPKNTGGLTVGYVGRFERHKGVMILIDAMRKLAGMDPSINLVFRGEGPLQPEMMRRIMDAGLEAHISIEPPEIREENIFHDIDLLVLPSLTLEGFGLVLIEAMSEGIPIVGSDTTGINEIIVDGYNGRLAPPGNSEALALCIHDTLKNDDARKRYIANGYKDIDERYSFEQYLSDYYRILNSL